MRLWMELADTSVLETDAFGRTGSTPVRRTNFMSIIHQHPEWKIVEEWFAKRANGNYAHTEKVEVSSSIDPETEKAATEMGRAAGESVRKILTNFWPCRSAHRTDAF